MDFLWRRYLSKLKIFLFNSWMFFPCFQQLRFLGYKMWERDFAILKYHFYKSRKQSAGMCLNQRILPVVFFLFTFLISLCSLTMLPRNAWLSGWWWTQFLSFYVVGFGILTSVAGLLLAYFFYSDHDANQ